MNKGSWVLCALGSLWLLTLGGGRAQAANSFWPESRKAQIWSVVTVHEGADLHQLQETMSQTRDEVRDRLWQQLTDTASQLVTPWTDSSQLARTLAGILMSFDRVHAMHKAEDKKGYDVTLSAQLQAGFERFMRENRIPAAERRAEFVSPSAATIRYLTQPQRGDFELVKSGALPVFPVGMDYVIALTWSGQGSFVELALSVERVIADARADGTLSVITKPITVGIRASWWNAGEVAGYALARLFQEIDPVPPVDPNGGLRWITHFVTGPNIQQKNHAEAESLCASQGARLPYAEELLLAESLGEFSPGGLPRLSQHVFFPVADRQREEFAVYFLNKSFASTPGGLVVSEGGLGPLQGYVFCVLGAPTLKIRQAQGIYEQLRHARDLGNLQAEDALEFLLIAIHDRGRRAPDSYTGSEIVRKFRGRSPASVVLELRTRGYFVDLTAYGITSGA